MKFGEKLKLARVKANLTQEAVAKQIGVSRQSLSNWENDRTYPDLASVLKLSDLYGLFLDVLGTVIGGADWYYPGSFDGSEPLSGLPLRAKGTIKLSVPGDSEIVTIYEEFRDGDSVEHQTMVLTKDKRGFVKFKRETRQNGGKQTGIYRIPYQNGEFVLVLNYAK